AARVCAAVRSAGLPHLRPASMAVDDVVSAARADKKARGGHAEYALPSRIGAMAAAERGWSVPVDDAITRQVLAESA
ncbi:MAG TPA: hypothetical protein VII52_15295, partial [Gemmatimonadaceae bacterium]